MVVNERVIREVRIGADHPLDALGLPGRQPFSLVDAANAADEPGFRQNGQYPADAACQPTEYADAMARLQIFEAR